MRLALTLERTGSTSHPAASGLLATVSALVTILTPVATIVVFFITKSVNIPAIILVVYICLVMSAFLVFSIKQEIRHNRDTVTQVSQHTQQLIDQEERHQQHLTEMETATGRAIRYASATEPLRKAFGRLANASWTMIEGDRSADSFLLQLRYSTEFLAEAFSTISGKPCRVAIKETAAATRGGHDLDLRVYTLCTGDEEEPGKPNDYDRIENNTDFKMIFAENYPYYFCNDLPAELARGLYQNSHWSPDVIRAGQFKYRATIVWPIARTPSQKSRDPKSREIIGFLCVDSPATDAFHETWDVPIGQAYSDALHLALARYRGT
jgi:hypothetical protein